MSNKSSTDLMLATCKYRLGSYQSHILKELDNLDTVNFASRFWEKDSSLWTNHDEGEWLGWLTIVDKQLEKLDELTNLSAYVKKRSFKHAVLLGMGGSSLCVEVLRQTFGSKPDYPQMLVLDSVVPAQIQTIRQEIDPSSTLFIVASKSGSTVEPNVLFQYFFAQAQQVLHEKAKEHFIAITDPNSLLEQQAKDLQFAYLFQGIPSIGGRFSALSPFGIVPATIMGLDIKDILLYANKMSLACTTAEDNPGLLLGTILAVLAKYGRNKVTFITSDPLASLGTWLEQLIAESTGKEGKGIVPVATETLLSPPYYGQDRLFVYIHLAGLKDNSLDQQVKELELAGQPLIKIELNDTAQLGAEFFRWEMATATAGSILGINAFNQPNVQESKDFTKNYLKTYVETASLPKNDLLHQEGQLKLYASLSTRKFLQTHPCQSTTAYIAAFLSQLKTGDYFAINAYLECNKHLEQKLQVLRDLVLQKYKVATTLGFGPRFLHSTGQLHKGGPNIGVFLQLTSDDKKDIPIPGEQFSFGILKEAQSLGDFQALNTRERRLLRIHLPEDVDAGLAELTRHFQAALN